MHRRLQTTRTLHLLKNSVGVSFRYDTDRATKDERVLILLAPGTSLEAIPYPVCVQRPILVQRLNGSIDTSSIVLPGQTVGGEGGVLWMCSADAPANAGWLCYLKKEDGICRSNGEV